MGGVSKLIPCHTGLRLREQTEREATTGNTSAHAGYTGLHRKDNINFIYSRYTLQVTDCNKINLSILTDYATYYS